VGSESMIALSWNTFYVFRMEPVSVGTYVDVTFTPQDANGQDMDVDEAGLSVICSVKDGSARRTFAAPDMTESSRIVNVTHNFVVTYTSTADVGGDPVFCQLITTSALVEQLGVSTMSDGVPPQPQPQPQPQLETQPQPQSLALPPASSSCDTARAPRPSLPAGIYLHDDGAVTSNAAESTVTVRFYLEDIHGEPISYLATTNFTVRHGINCRALYEANDEQEGSIAVNKQGQRYFGSTRFMSLLIDSSNTVEPEEMRNILVTFVEALQEQRGDIYVKLICFSGGRQLLTLTTDCPEEFCSVHNQTEWDLLNGIVQAYESELEEWDAWDPRSTSFYQSVYKAAQEFKLASRARAHLLLSNPDHAPASTTTEHLIIFSDVDETAYPVAVPDRDPNDNSMRSKMFQALRQGDLSSTVSLIYLDQQGDSYETVTSDITELDAVLKHVYEATQVADLAGVFLDMAVRIDREANAWYELILCPPERGGENIYLQVQTPEYDGSLEVYFDAKGFTKSCPESQSFSQAESSSLCDQRSCGFEVRHWR
jgi:hypothetical protein